MTYLIPDITKDNKPDFVWANAIDAPMWWKWRTKATKDNDAVCGVPWMEMTTSRGLSVILLPDESMSDDQTKEAAAYIRIVKKYTGLIYVVRCQLDAGNLAKMMCGVIGADPALTAYVNEKENLGG